MRQNPTEHLASWYVMLVSLFLVLGIGCSFVKYVDTINSSVNMYTTVHSYLGLCQHQSLKM